MKNNLQRFLRNAWLLLTEVPGWADAPLSVRVQRTLPIVVPCMGIVAVLVWSLAWQTPRIRAERELHAPQIALEAEIQSLQLAYSEQQTVELAEQAEQASHLLVPNQAELVPFLRTLKKEAADRGWEAGFHPGEPVTEGIGDGAQISYQPVRVKLAPVAGHAEVYASLLSLLERFSTSGRRIDLMRLAIRADENRWQTVEANLRLAYPILHAQTSQ
ncbi:MAG TPA: hypothetical protein VG734_02935 [Lacunisphaera sp.]|nr:hypothetical protein [Lacunisphaera sp.]